MSDDLKRDLKLATTAQPIVQISADELAPEAHKAVSLALKKAPGPKVIASKRPTVKASQTPTQVAEMKSEVPAVQVIASAPSAAEAEAPAAPPTARPAPVEMPASAGRSTGTENGAGAEGSGIGAVLGGIFGAVIRGGIVVGDDKCDPRTDGRRRGGGAYPRVPVYSPPVMGGMGGMRLPPSRGRPRM